MSEWDLPGCLLAVCVIVILIVFVGIAAVGGDELINGRATFEKQVACERQRLEPRRKLFTTEVVCVPVRMRQDTTTLNVVPK